MFILICMTFQVAVQTFEVRVKSSVLHVKVEVCKDMARRIGACSGHWCGHGGHWDCCCQAGGQVAVRCVLPCPAHCGGCRAVTCSMPYLSSSLACNALRGTLIYIHSEHQEPARKVKDMQLWAGNRAAMSLRLYIPDDAATQLTYLQRSQRATEQQFDMPAS